MRSRVALDALGAAGLADLASVPDQLVREKDPAILRDDAHEVLLDFLGIGVAGEVEAGGEALDVGVHDHAGSDAERRAQHDVGGLARHAGQREQFLHRARDFLAEIVDQLLAGALDGLGLVAEETGRADFGFEFARIGVGEIFRRLVFLKERASHFVDADIGALRGEDCRDQQLEGVAMIQRAGDAGIGLVQFRQDGADAPGAGSQRP